MVSMNNHAADLGKSGTLVKEVYSTVATTGVSIFCNGKPNSRGRLGTPP